MIRRDTTYEWIIRRWRHRGWWWAQRDRRIQCAEDRRRFFFFSRICKLQSHLDRLSSSHRPPLQSFGMVAAWTRDIAATMKSSFVFSLFPYLPPPPIDGNVEGACIRMRTLFSFPTCYVTRPRTLRRGGANSRTQSPHEKEDRAWPRTVEVARLRARDHVATSAMTEVLSVPPRLPFRTVL